MPRRQFLFHPVIRNPCRSKKPRQKTVPVEEHVLLCVRDDSILLEQESGTRRKGLWKLPEIKTGANLGKEIEARETDSHPEVFDH